ncbi:MAG: hypothetical protein ABJN65_16310 [Parasphingorhabdus sp.]
MTKRLPIFPMTAALSAVLILSACGKQEAVGDVPSGEELAKQADEASAAIRDEAEAAEQAEASATAEAQELTLTSYTNALRGYTIMVPEAWNVDEDVSDDDGQTTVAPDNGGTLTVSWSENRDNADMTAAIEATEKAGETMAGDQVSDDEYRASGTQEDNKTLDRILRQPDGSMVRARISYPNASAEQMDAIANQIIDSLALK